MAPYKVLYGRKYQSLLCWYEAGELSLLGLELVAKTTEQIKKIQARIFIAQSHQKSYANRRRKPLEFEEGDHVFLKATPIMGVGRAIKLKKLKSRYMKYTSDVTHILEPESVQMKENLTFQVALVRIDDVSVKQLCEKEVLLVKVACSQVGVEEHTWGLEFDMRKDYPYLFVALIKDLFVAT
ncbi:uncharacterized protein LOC130963058 [Arachis stenosperma]|uniref:uncharacterized protein LOC130963058 n=1 Tax=Arachis stenosperma TaxID=217475 RepID=UPI0025AC3C45|nr:uncharacterized protein LOC130963058 [Arachis stenosperma]